MTPPVRLDLNTDRKKIRLIIADDHPIFRDGLCLMLALEEDFEVVAQAQDGLQVLRRGY